jgi:hypothetical protein
MVICKLLDLHIVYCILYIVYLCETYVCVVGPRRWPCYQNHVDSLRKYQQDSEGHEHGGDRIPQEARERVAIRGQYLFNATCSVGRSAQTSLIIATFVLTLDTRNHAKNKSAAIEQVAFTW